VREDSGAEVPVDDDHTGRGEQSPDEDHPFRAVGEAVGQQPGGHHHRDQRDPRRRHRAKLASSDDWPELMKGAEHRHREECEHPHVDRAHRPRVRRGGGQPIGGEPGDETETDHPDGGGDEKAERHRRGRGHRGRVTDPGRWGDDGLPFHFF
jgi:hypothetical protein